MSVAKTGCKYGPLVSRPFDRFRRCRSTRQKRVRRVRAPGWERAHPPGCISNCPSAIVSTVSRMRRVVKLRCPQRLYVEPANPARLLCKLISKSTKGRILFPLVGARPIVERSTTFAAAGTRHGPEKEVLLPPAELAVSNRNGVDETLDPRDDSRQFLLQNR